MNKYDVAALIAIAGLDTNEYMKLSAAQQRELFGYNAFGKVNVRFNPDGQGCIELYRSCCYGTDIAWTTYTYEELAAKINNKQKVMI